VSARDWAVAALVVTACVIALCAMGPATV